MTLLSVPVYPGAAVMNVGQNHTLQYIPKTDETTLNAYLRDLETAGFRPIFERRDCGNFYATYTAETAGVHLYYIPDTRTVRVISWSSKDISLPSFSREEKVNQQFPSTVTQSILDYYYYDEKDPASRSDGNYGACYIVTLDDGSLLIYDGGGKWGKNDVDRIWGLIRERAVPNQEGKIVIAGWIITHEHVDHFWCMHHVLLGHSDDILLKALYCTPIAPELLVGRCTPADKYIDSPDMLPSLSCLARDFKLIRMHTGQIFWIRNVMVEVLCTPEDIFPEYAAQLDDFNDTTTVTRLTVNQKTFLNLGDAYRVASRILVEHWGNTLKSDYCTLAHHGWGGGTRLLYDHIQPSLVFVPFSRRWLERILTDATYLSDSGRTNRYIQWALDRYGDFHKVTQHVFFDLLAGNSDRFFLADGCNKTLDMSTGRVHREITCNEQVGYPY